MIGDDNLHVRKLGTVSAQQREELMHRSLVLVFKAINLPFLIALRRVVRL